MIINNFNYLPNSYRNFSGSIFFAMVFIKCQLIIEIKHSTLNIQYSTTKGSPSGFSLFLHIRLRSFNTFKIIAINSYFIINNSIFPALPAVR